MRLFLVELLRYRSRRAVKGAGLLIVAAIAVASTIVFFNSENDAAAVASGQRQQERFARQCVRDFERFGGELPPGYDSVEDFCAEATPVSVSDPRFHLEGLTDVLTGLSPLIVILGLGLGATFIGAEWNTGTLTTMLTWEPRRARVLLTKGLAAGAFVFVGALCVQALLGLALTPAAALRGTLEGIDAGWFAETVGVAVRSGLLAALAAVIGFSFASVARNTGASIIVAFVYFAILENVIRAYRPNWTRWIYGDNAALFVSGQDQSGLGSAHSETRALLTIVAYAVLLVVVATAVFRRRDVT